MTANTGDGQQVHMGLLRLLLLLLLRLLAIFKFLP